MKSFMRTAAGGLIVLNLLSCAMAGSDPGSDPVSGSPAAGTHQEAWDQLFTVDQLRMQFATFRRLTAQLAELVPKIAAHDSLLRSLADEIELLKLENQFLCSMLESGSQQYVSTDGDDFQTSERTATMSKLASSLIAMNEKLDRYMKHKYVASSALPETTSSGTVHALGLDLTGFVDASGSTDNVSRGSSFNLNQLEIDLERTFQKRATFRADVEFASAPGENFGLNLEQGFVSYALDKNGRFVGTFGKFNAPIGYEVQDAPDNYLYSYGYIFTLGLPTNVTGLMASVKMSHVLDLKAYFVNGWNLNADNNKSKTLGIRLGITPSSGANVGLSVLSGNEQPDGTGGRRTVFDMDLTIMPGRIWCLGGDFTIGSEAGTPEAGAVARFAGLDLSEPYRQPGFFSVNPRRVSAASGTRTARWSAMMLVNHLHLTENFSIHVRADYFNDHDGWRTGTPQELKAVAVAPSVTIVDGLTGLTEFRYDWSNRSYFSTTAGPGRSSMFTTALQFVYSF